MTSGVALHVAVSNRDLRLLTQELANLNILGACGCLPSHHISDAAGYLDCSTRRITKYFCLVCQ